MTHNDPYCETHCRPGVKHSQCGCTCDHTEPPGWWDWDVDCAGRDCGECDTCKTRPLPAECANPECDHDRSIPSPGCALRHALERLCVAAERNGVWGGIDPRDVRAELGRYCVLPPEGSAR
jgi:hypothetical protein